MKVQIEQVLEALVGLPLQSAGRTMDMESFQFGALLPVSNRFGIAVRGEYSLHVQTAWRIAGPTGIVVGSRDRFYPAGDPTSAQPEFDWSPPGVNRCDERISAFIAGHLDNPLKVIAIQADLVGGIHVSLSEGFTLEVFPDDSLDTEYWRLLQHSREGSHFVVTGRGIED